MRARMSCTVVVGLLLAATLAGCGGPDARTVSYVHDVCTTMTEYAKQYNALSDRFASADVGSRIELRASMVSYVAGLQAATVTAVRGLQDAGSPAIEHGTKIAGYLTAAMQGQESVMATAATAAHSGSTTGSASGSSLGQLVVTGLALSAVGGTATVEMALYHGPLASVAAASASCSAFVNVRV